MTDWSAMTAGDFDRKRAPKSALAAADAGQDALFPGTPTLPAKPAPQPVQLSGQGGLFDDDGQDASEPDGSEAGHEPDPDPEQGAFDVCCKCGQPIVRHWATGAWVTMTGTANAECYGRRS